MFAQALAHRAFISSAIDDNVPCTKPGCSIHASPCNASTTRGAGSPPAAYATHRLLSAWSPRRPHRESALLAFNGEHLLPAERPYAWLGSLRPSEAAAGLLAKLGDDVSAAAVGRLHTLQVSEELGGEVPAHAASICYSLGASLARQAHQVVG
jgi:hypothetical protein